MKMLIGLLGDDNIRPPDMSNHTLQDMKFIVKKPPAFLKKMVFGGNNNIILAQQFLTNRHAKNYSQFMTIGCKALMQLGK